MLSLCNSLGLCLSSVTVAELSDDELRALEDISSCPPPYQKATQSPYQKATQPPYQKATQPLPSAGACFNLFTI